MPLKEVCVECNQRMQVDQIGVPAIEYQDKQKTQPYRVWQCDTVRCPKCTTVAATRFANKPTANFESDFAGVLAEAEANPNVIRFY